MTFFKVLTSASAAIILAATLFVAAPLSSSAQETDVLPARVTDFATRQAPDDHVVGSENAAITLIIWASVTCPHCAQWFSKDWPVIKTELVETGKLRVVFRQFPTPPMDMALTGFRIAGCAPTENYMSIIEHQMENQKNIFEAAREGRAPEVYTEIAKMAGMETDDAIASCLRNPDITAHIIDNTSRAQIAEINSVPAFLINGERYKGHQDAKSLVKLITDMDEKGITSLPKNLKPANTHAGHDHE